MGKRSSKFKELLKEIAGGVVSTPAINSQGGLGYTERSDKERYGFEFDPDGMPNSSGPSEKSAFSETQTNSRSVVLYEDENGAVTLRKSAPQNYEIVVRKGSKEMVSEVDGDTVSRIKQLFS